jgi:thiol-disulfide isomerase/thioredoxin
MVTIKTEIADRNEFQTILDNNEGIVIIKFGATWCNPCKTIAPFVKEMVNKLPNTFTVYDLDIDDNFEVYAFLKSKKMVSGIPTLLAYYRENKSFASSQCVSGTDENAYKQFFIKCISESIRYKV